MLTDNEFDSVLNENLTTEIVEYIFYKNNGTFVVDFASGTRAYEGEFEPGSNPIKGDKFRKNPMTRKYQKVG